MRDGTICVTTLGATFKPPLNTYVPSGRTPRGIGLIDRGIGIQFIPSGRHIALPDLLSEGQVIVEMEVPVHFHRVDHARAQKVVLIVAAALQVEVRLRRVNGSDK